MSVATADVLAVACSALVVAVVWGAVAGTLQRPDAVLVTLWTVTFVAALAASGSYGRRNTGLFPSYRALNLQTWNGLMLGTVVALLVSRLPFVDLTAPVTVEQTVLVALVALALIPLARLAVPIALRRGRRRRRVLILGTGKVAASVSMRLQRSRRVSVIGLVDDDPQEESGVLGTLAELPRICRELQIDDVLVAFSRKLSHETLDMLRGLEGQVSIWVVPRLYELVSWRSAIEELNGVPLLDVAPAQNNRLARAGKRVMDLVGASLALVVLSPLLVATAITVKLTSPGPVLFRQARSGRGGYPFLMYKFRTMEADAETRRSALASCNEVDGPLFKMRHDPRVTRVGRWLRQTSLDELPQLLNVLRGEMSLVGPRPFPVAESQAITGWAVLRFSVPPGMTGLWQVSGRNALTYDDLRHLDYVYAASWSLLWDLKILLQTPACVLHRRGVL